MINWNRVALSLFLLVFIVSGSLLAGQYLLGLVFFLGASYFIAWYSSVPVVEGKELVVRCFLGLNEKRMKISEITDVRTRMPYRSGLMVEVEDGEGRRMSIAWGLC